MGLNHLHAIVKQVNLTSVQLGYFCERLDHGKDSHVLLFFLILVLVPVALQKEGLHHVLPVVGQVAIVDRAIKSQF